MGRGHPQAESNGGCDGICHDDREEPHVLMAHPVVLNEPSDGDAATVEWWHTRQDGERDGNG